MIVEVAIEPTDAVEAAAQRASDRELTGWTCASPKPGVTVRPRSSTTRVRGPISLPTAASSPTATIRPPRTAMALATEPAAVHRLDPAARQDEVGGGRSSAVTVARMARTRRALASIPSVATAVRGDAPARSIDR